MIRNKKKFWKFKGFSKSEIFHIISSILLGLIGLARVGYFAYRSADDNNIDFLYNTHTKERQTKKYGEIKISDKTAFYINLEDENYINSQIFLNQLEAEKYFKNNFISQKDLSNYSYLNALFDQQSAYSLFMNYLEKVDFNNDKLILIKSNQKDYEPTQLKLENNKLILLYDAVAKANKTTLIFLAIDKTIDFELEKKYFKYFIAKTKKDY